MDIRAHQLDLFDAHLATQENRNGRLPHLRQQRNELVLLSFLPPELVTYILEYLIHDAITSDTLISFFDWTAATQIYGYWRNVALCAPLLWTRIRGQNLAWTRAFLERSKGLPLNVSLEQSGWEELRHDGRPRRWYDEFIGVVAGDMYRIKTLHIVLSDHDSWVLDSTLPSHLLSLTAPALRTLIITDDMDEYEWGDRSWFVRLIPACMPDLRDFRVRNMRPSTLDWLPCLYLPTVTSLTIHSDNCNDDDDDEDDICFVQSAVLSYCPNVGELMIFGNGTSGYEYPHRVLKLHKLDFLHAVKPSFDLLMGYDFSDTAFTRIVLEFPLNEWVDPEYDWFREFAAFTSQFRYSKVHQLDHFVLYLYQSLNALSFVEIYMLALDTNEQVFLALRLTACFEELTARRLSLFRKRLTRFESGGGLEVRHLMLDLAENHGRWVEIIRRLRGFPYVEAVVAPDKRGEEVFEHFIRQGDPQCRRKKAHPEVTECQKCMEYLKNAFPRLRCLTRANDALWVKE